MQKVLVSYIQQREITLTEIPSVNPLALTDSWLSQEFIIDGKLSILVAQPITVGPFKNSNHQKH